MRNHATKSGNALIAIDAYIGSFLETSPIGVDRARLIAYVNNIEEEAFRNGQATGCIHLEHHIFATGPIPVEDIGEHQDRTGSD